MKKKPGRRRFLANLGMASGVLGVSSADADSKTLPRSAHHYFDSVLNPCFVDERIDSRSVTPENPTGERGAGCLSVRLEGVRKGRKSGRWIATGERLVLADIQGPGTLRHIWMALDWYRPEYI